MKSYSAIRFLLLVIVVFKTIILTAQTSDSAAIDKKIDSLYLQKNDSAYAFSSVYEVIKESKKINYKSGIAAATQLLGYLYFEYGDYDQAKKYLYEALAINKTIKNDKVMAQNLRLLAIYLDGKEEYSKALELIFQSLRIRMAIKDEKGIADCYISIGIIYHRTLELKAAIFYYNKALAYFTKTKNDEKSNSINSNLGAAYNDLGKLDSALYFLKKVMAYKQKKNEKIGLAKAYHNIGTNYSRQGKFEKAFDYYNLKINTTGDGANNANNGISYEAAGSMLIKLKRFDEAEKYLKTAEKIYRKNALNKSIANCYDKLSFLYESKGDYFKSNQYNSLSNMLQDSIQIVENNESFAEIEAKYKAIEKTKENELLSAENKALENELKYDIILVIGLVVTFLLIAFLVYNLKQIRDTRNELISQNLTIEGKNKEVIIQNDKLAKLNEENQTLMSVLAHDLRSPFSKVVGLVNLLNEEDEKEATNTYLNYITDICNDALQLIQDTISLSEIFHENRLDFEAKMESFSPSELLNNLTNSFKATALNKGIGLVMKDGLQQVELYNSKGYLTRILDNILSNAIKFSHQNTTIIFSTLRVNNKVVFSIKDQGPGLSDSDKKQLFLRFKKLSAKPTGNEASSGLGLFIVKQLTDMIGGEITVISEKGNGTEFILKMPIVFPKTTAV